MHYPKDEVHPVHCCASPEHRHAHVVGTDVTLDKAVCRLAHPSVVVVCHWEAPHVLPPAQAETNRQTP